MAAFTEVKRRLRAVYAAGWISSWEASRLKVGTVVLAATKAGEDLEIRFGEIFMASGSAVIVSMGAEGGLAAARIDSLERPLRADPEPDRGDQLLELLPFELVYGEADYTLAELDGAGVGSLISLDSPYPPEGPVPVRMCIAGIDTAVGRCVVMGELFGMVVDRLETPCPAFGEPRFGANVLAAGLDTTGVKLYDWKRPDRFTRACIASVLGIHRRIVEALGVRWPLLASWTVRCVDQLTIGEWFESPDSATESVLRMNMDRLSRDYGRESTAPGPRRALAQPHGARHPFPPGFEEELSRFLSLDEARMGERLVFAFASGAAGAALEELDPFLSALRSGWKLVGDCRFTDAERLDGKPELLGLDLGRKETADPRSMMRDEMIVLVSLGGPNGSLHLVYSARSLYPLMKTLDRYGALELNL